MTAPCLFDQRGEFLPLDEQQLATLTAPERACYDQVLAASQKCTEADRLLAEATRSCTEAVAEMREIESQLAAVPKVSFQDCWRSMRDGGG